MTKRWQFAVSVCSFRQRCFEACEAQVSAALLCADKVTACEAYVDAGHCPGSHLLTTAACSLKGILRQLSGHCSPAHCLARSLKGLVSMTAHLDMQEAIREAEAGIA